jgi:predicted peptidase
MLRTANFCFSLSLSLSLLLTSGLTQSPSAQETAIRHGFITEVWTAPNGEKVAFDLFVPYSYTGKEPFPLILFLHGAGEREGGKQKPVDVGIGPAIRKYGEKDFPFFVVFPRCRANRNWMAEGDDAQRALAILEFVQKKYKIDEQRIYLTGLSLGGFGTWSLAARYPDKWAAIVPICGGGNPEWAEKIKHIPVWCFHGDQDKAVRVELSRRMIEALKAAGASPRYTEYPGVGHNCWDLAYNTKELYAWLLSQKRPR